MRKAQTPQVIIKLRLHVFLSNDLFKSKGSFFSHANVSFFLEWRERVLMINVDASAGKRRAGDRTKDKEKPSLEVKNTAIPRNLFSNNNQRSR